VPVADRWRIAAYIRALQLTQRKSAGAAADQKFSNVPPSLPGEGRFQSHDAANTEAK
jgi:hypothetical protein